MSIYTQALNHVSFLTLLSLLGSLALPQSAKADSWQYVSDQKNDSANLYRGTSNFKSFDIRGMGFRDDGSDIWVGVSADMNERGHTTIGNTVDGFLVPNQNIGWGDMLFDFSGRNSFKQASTNGELFGVRFTPFNDSPVATGVYRNVKGLGVQEINAGYGNFGRLNNAINKKPMNVGELSWQDPYWGVYSDATYGYKTDPIANVIDSDATRIGDVQFLNYQSLYDNGFSRTPDQFEHGQFLFGFKFAKSLLPSGNFVGSLFQECLNDAIAFRGSIAPPLALPVVPPVVPPSPPVAALPVTPLVPPTSPIASPTLPVETPIVSPPITTKVPEPSGIITLGFAGLIAIVRSRKARK